MKDLVSWYIFNLYRNLPQFPYAHNEVWAQYF